MVMSIYNMLIIVRTMCLYRYGTIQALLALLYQTYERECLNLHMILYFVQGSF
jgi:hypothetical protein